MADILDHLKARARILHRHAEGKSPTALARLRKLVELKSLDDDQLAASVRRRHCLAVVAREIGFDGWTDATRALGDTEDAQFGALLYPPSVWGHWNIWCASHDEAKRVRSEHGGYLLTYKHQYLVVDADYIDAMGLDRHDPDWALIGRDWAVPNDRAARQRLADKIVRQRLAGINPGP
jgi:hypothetical protein